MIYNIGISRWCGPNKTNPPYDVLTVQAKSPIAAVEKARDHFGEHGAARNGYELPNVYTDTYPTHDDYSENSFA